MGNWGANELTALFTGLSVVTMAVVIIQNVIFRRQDRLAAAPDPKLSFSANGEITVYLSKDSSHAIAAIRMNPRVNLIQLVPGPYNEYASYDFIEAGRPCTTILFDNPSTQARFKLEDPARPSPQLWVTLTSPRFKNVEIKLPFPTKR